MERKEFSQVGEQMYHRVLENGLNVFVFPKHEFRKGYAFFKETSTNQQFILLENSQMERLAPLVGFSVWEPAGDHHTVVRFATCWATTEEDLARLEEIL